MLIGYTAVFPLSVAILGLGVIGLTIYDAIPIIGMAYKFAYYALFFVLGIVLFALQGWVNIIESNLLKLSVATGFVGIVFLLLPNSDTLVLKIVNQYFSVLLSLLMSLTLWAVFAKLLNKPKAWLSSLSSAPYTMYLYHYVLIVGVVAVIISLYLDFDPLILFILLIMTVFSLCWLSHRRLIAKFKLMQLVFNGR